MPAGIGTTLIWIVVIAAAVVCTLLALRYFEITPPPILIKVFWVLVVAVAVVYAIKFLMTM